MFTRVTGLFKKNWKINRAVIDDVFVKLGLFSITGGVVGYVFDDKIDAVTALYAIFIGVFFIFVGALRPLGEKE